MFHMIGPLTKHLLRPCAHDQRRKNDVKPGLMSGLVEYLCTDFLFFLGVGQGWMMNTSWRSSWDHDYTFSSMIEWMKISYFMSRMSTLAKCGPGDFRGLRSPSQ